MPEPRKFPLKLPPGMFRNGTEYQAKGRWIDGNLVRFVEKTIRPIGGWSNLQKGTPPADITFNATAVLAVTANPADTETVTIDGKAYTFQTSLTDVDGNVLIGADQQVSLDNLIAAIILDTPIAGRYAASTTVHSSVTAQDDPDKRATGVLTMTANPTDTETVVIDGKTYTFQDTLTDSDGNVLIGSTTPASLDNLIAAIRLTASGKGLTYAALMTLHSTVTALAGTGDTMDATAKTGGFAGDALATTETLANGSWGAATLSGADNAMRVDAKVSGLAPASIALLEGLANGSWNKANMIAGVPRALMGWRSNAAIAPQLAIGTNAQILHFTQGALQDLTPSGLVTGLQDSSFGVGAYGSGPYGVGKYGVGDPAQSTFTEAATWSLDAFGDFLVGVLTSDGRCWVWNQLTSKMEVMDSSPTNCDAMVVTSERFVFALGAGGDPRLVQWADRESLTLWSPAVTNEAGSLPLPGEGVLMMGLRGKSETLLFTDADLFAARYIGGVLVYGFPKVGSKCGVISRHGAVVLEGRAIWMGQRGFFNYDGYVTSLPSDVSDYVFGDFNRTQRAKVWAVTQSDFGEVWWFYPSSTSMEPDRYVIYNYLENHWTTGDLERTAGIDRLAFEFPMMADTVNIMDHEAGARIGSPFLDSGPIEIGNGERVIDADELIPDESTSSGGQVLGSLRVRLFSRYDPTDTEVEIPGSPFTLANPTPIRLSGRQVRVRIEETTAADWRLGNLRLQGQPGSRR